MNEPHPFRVIDLARRAERLAEHERRRERRRLALMRPAARAEYDRVMHEPEPPVQVDVEDWLMAILVPLAVDGPITVERLRAALWVQLEQIDTENLAERLTLLSIPERLLGDLADEFDDAA